MVASSRPPRVTWERLFDAGTFADADAATDPFDLPPIAEPLDEMADLKQRDPAAYEARMADAETAAMASFDRGE